MDINHVVTGIEMKRFCEGRKVSGICPCCGQLNWDVESPSKDSQWALTASSRDGGFKIPQPAIPVVTLICQNCSFVRTHAFMGVITWLLENPES